MAAASGSGLGGGGGDNNIVTAVEMMIAREINKTKAEYDREIMALRAHSTQELAAQRARLEALGRENEELRARVEELSRGKRERSETSGDDEGERARRPPRKRARRATNSSSAAEEEIVEIMSVDEKDGNDGDSDHDVQDSAPPLLEEASDDEYDVDCDDSDEEDDDVDFDDSDDDDSDDDDEKNDEKNADTLVDNFLQVGNDANTRPRRACAVRAADVIAAVVAEDAAVAAEVGAEEHEDQPIASAEFGEPRIYEMGPEFQQALQNAKNKSVTYFGTRTKIERLLNIPIEDLATIVVDRGSWIIQGVEQGNKSIVISGIAVASAELPRAIYAPVRDDDDDNDTAMAPFAVFVNDKRTNVDTLPEKMNVILNKFGITAQVFTKKRDFTNLRPAEIDSIKSGRLLIVCICNMTKFKDFASFVVKHGLYNITAVLDEADSVFTKAVKIGCTKRERAWYRLIEGLSGRPLGKGSRVRTIVHVSATNLATIVWHHHQKLPFRSLWMNLDEIRAKGYTVYEDIVPMKMAVPADPAAPGPSTGQVGVEREVFLDVDLSKDKHKRFGFDSEEVLYMYKKFREDRRDNLLMLVALSPRLDAGAFNQKVICKESLRRMGNRKTVVLLKCGKGVVRYDANTTDAEFEQRINATAKDDGAPQEQLKSTLNKELSAALEDIPADVAVILVGYQCMSRCVSTRSRYRVPTHVICGPRPSKTSADTNQMIMRAGGYVEGVRTQKVELLCLEEDYNILQQLYEFTVEALKVAGTGRIEDLDKWFEETYEPRYGVVTRAGRSHVPKKLGGNELIAGLCTREELELEVVDVDPRAGVSAKDMLSFFYQFYKDCGDEVQDVSYGMMRARGYTPDERNRKVVQKMKEDEWIELVRGGVYRITTKGIRIAETV